MTFEEAQTLQTELQEQVIKTSAALKAFPRLINGLTPDSVKSSLEYKLARISYDGAFNRLRNFNAQFNKLYAKEIRLNRR